MKCGHCGASNSDTAKFCGKCAVRLRAHSAAGPAKRPYVAPREDDIETVIQMDDAFVSKDAAVALAAPLQTSVFSSTKSSSTKAAPKPAPAVDMEESKKTRRQRRSVIVAVVAGAVVIAGAGGAWLARDSQVTAAKAKNAEMVAAVSSSVTAQNVPAVPASNSVVVPPLAAKAALAPDPVVTKLAESAPIPQTQLASERLDKKEKAKDLKPAPVKQKVEPQLARKGNAASTARVDDTAKPRDALVRSNQDDATRLGKLKTQQQISLPTPQQACADRSNFISRGICESRECEKPERASLKFCIDMKARRAPREYAN